MHDITYRQILIDMILGAVYHRNIMDWCTTNMTHSKDYMNISIKELFVLKRYNQFCNKHHFISFSPWGGIGAKPSLKPSALEQHDNE